MVTEKESDRGRCPVLQRLYLEAPWPWTFLSFEQEGGPIGLVMCWLSKTESLSLAYIPVKMMLRWMEVFSFPQVFFHFPFFGFTFSTADSSSMLLWGEKGGGRGNENICGFYYIYGSIFRKRRFSFQAPRGKYYEKHSFSQFGPLRGKAWPGRGQNVCVTGYGQDTMIVITQDQKEAPCPKGKEECSCHRKERRVLCWAGTNRCPWCWSFPGYFYIMKTVFLPIYYTTLDSIKIGLFVIVVLFLTLHVYDSIFFSIHF